MLGQLRVLGISASCHDAGDAPVEKVRPPIQNSLLSLALSLDATMFMHVAWNVIFLLVLQACMVPAFVHRSVWPA